MAARSPLEFKEQSNNKVERQIKSQPHLMKGKQGKEGEQYAVEEARPRTISSPMPLQTQGMVSRQLCVMQVWPL